MNYSMRKLPFWRELIKQSDLEAQYEVLKQRGYSDHDTAIHLARFAEARMHNAADRRITELEGKSMRDDVWFWFYGVTIGFIIGAGVGWLVHVWWIGV